MKLGIVADGKERNHQANFEQVLTEVRQEYTKQGQPRSAWQKFWLERRIRQEVSARLHKMFSSQNNYLTIFIK
jgi:hypothetical protein